MTHGTGPHEREFRTLFFWVFSHHFGLAGSDSTLFRPQASLSRARSGALPVPFGCLGSRARRPCHDSVLICPFQYRQFRYNGGMQKAEMLTSCFGLGKIPVAPGTFGSLGPVVMFQVLAYLWPAANAWVMVFFLLAGSWVCLQYSSAVIAATGNKDPQQVVADEVAGQALVMLFIALLRPEHICNTVALGFLLFRLFDIVKPWPCRRLEELPGGVGILADDLMAGIYACIGFAIAYYLLPQYCA